MTITIIDLKEVRHDREGETARDIAEYVEKNLNRLPNNVPAIVEFFAEKGWRCTRMRESNPIATYINGLPLINWTFTAAVHGGKVHFQYGEYRAEITLPPAATDFHEQYMGGEYSHLNH